MYELKVGADPELFLRKGSNCVSSHNICPGTKASPVNYLNSIVQADGTACEFNIPPASTAEEFVYSILSSLQDIGALAESHNLGIFDGCVAHYSKDYLESLPPIAVELGCSPDFNAYTGRANEMPNQKMPFRTAAGHVHLGFEVYTSEERRNMVKQLDVVLGIPSILYDSNTQRRELYGKAGAYRPKSYGLEYRVLSNAWIFSTNLSKWVFEQTRNAFDKFKEGDFLFKKVDEAEIINTINFSDRKNAEKIVAKLGLIVP